MHAVLSEIHREGQPLDEVFDHIFRLKCEELRVLPGYRTEALRHRMLTDLRALIGCPQWDGRIRDTHGAEVPLRSQRADVEISGRIDRAWM